MTPADLARRLFRDQCNIGPNSALEAYGETAAVAAMVPLIEALVFYADHDADGYRVDVTNYGLSTEEGEIIRDGGERARAALAPQPEEVA